MVKPVFHIIVVSDHVYEGLEEDVSGEEARKTIESRGYRVLGKTVIPNKYREIIRVIRETREANTLLFLGGTGPSPRDITVDVLESIAWRKIPGFGEYFRLRSFEEIGYRGLLSRSELYILNDGRIAVALPGSTGAVKLGLEILLNVIEHLLEETTRFEGKHKIHQQ